MVMVVLYGITGGFVADEIKEVLSKYGVLSLCGQRVQSFGKGNKFLVLEFATRADIRTDCGIIVTVGEIAESCFLKLPESFFGVVYSADKNALKLLKARKIKTVTCGMSTSDTVMLSSITKSTASVCLQRKITTVFGQTVDPQEFKVILHKKITDYALMASFAVMLLSGITPKIIEI